MKRAALALLLLPVAACGLTTTERSGGVGDELSADGLEATLLKVSDRSDAYGAKVRVCTDSDQAIRAYDFELEPEDGDKVRPLLPQREFSNDFDLLRSGCEDGWIVFAVDRRGSAKALHFTYDDTGQGGPGGSPEKHARFRWDLR